MMDINNEACRLWYSYNDVAHFLLQNEVDDLVQMGQGLRQVEEMQQFTCLQEKFGEYGSRPEIISEIRHLLLQPKDILIMLKRAIIDLNWVAASVMSADWPNEQPLPATSLDNNHESMEHSPPYSPPSSPLNIVNPVQGVPSMIAIAQQTLKEFQQPHNLRELFLQQHKLHLHSPNNRPYLRITTQKSHPAVVTDYAKCQFDPTFELEIVPNDTQILGPVEAILLNQNFQVEGQREHLEQHKQTMQHGKCTFHGLKIKRATRMKLKFILFLARVQSGDQQHWVGAISNPIIVVANTDQCAKAEARVIWFGFGCPHDQGMVHWKNIEKILAIYLQIRRELKKTDLEFLKREKFRNQTPPSGHDPDMVPWKSFLAFWEWIYKTKQTIENHLKDIWWRPLPTGEQNERRYVIDGFVGREDAEALIRQKGKGYFIVRFSTRVPGDIVISYMFTDTVPRHILVNPSEDFQGGRRLDDIIRYDYDDLKFMHPGVPKEEAFTNPTNCPNPKRLNGYTRAC